MSESDVATRQREGFALALVGKLFPGMQKQAPKEFRNDVQFFYDWSVSASGTRLDPLNINKHGDYNSVHDAELASLSFLHSKNESALLKALKSGNYNAAKKHLPYDVVVSGKAKLPSPVTSSGDLGSTGVPSTLDEIGGTLADLPGAAAKDAGTVGGGLGTLLGNHTVLIVLVIALILVMKK